MPIDLPVFGRSTFLYSQRTDASYFPDAFCLMVMEQIRP